MFVTQSARELEWYVYVCRSAYAFAATVLTFPEPVPSSQCQQGTLKLTPQMTQPELDRCVKMQRRSLVHCSLL